MRSVTEGVARLNYCLNGSPFRLYQSETYHNLILDASSPSAHYPLGRYSSEDLADHVEKQVSHW